VFTLNAATDSPFVAYHYGGLGVGVQPADEGVSLGVDGALVLDGLLIHRLAVHVQGDVVALHADHHLVPLGVEEHGEAGKGGGLQVAVGAHQEVLQRLQVPVEPQSGLLVAVLVHYLPDVPHFAHRVLDHAERHHDGVLVGEAAGKVQPSGREIEHRGVAIS